MKRNYKMFIEDIIGSIEKIEKYIGDLEYADFEKDSLVIDAVVRNLEIIGEAAKNVPEDVRLAHPEISWNRMIGLRNITIHEYFGVDLGIVWEIITKNLPETKELIVDLLKGL
jgi:uncharacterized protein with HEPN domain